MFPEPEQADEETDQPVTPPGDPKGVESLFAQNMAPLVAFIRSQLGPTLAARESATDLAQSVCREVLQDLDRFEYRGAAAFRSWLFQQAVRKILDRNRYFHRARRDIRREAGSIVPEDDVEALAECYASLCTPSQQAEAREELQHFERALAALPKDQRDAVTMSRIMGLGYGEIAALMDCSESAVRGLVARGLAAVAAQLG